MILKDFTQKQTDAILWYFQKFEEWDEREQIEKERLERISKIRELLSSPEKIDNLTKDEIDIIEGSLWAYQSRFKRWISNENEISNIRKTFKYLLFGKDDIFLRAQKVSKDPEYKISYFGESKISELLFKANTKDEISLLNDRTENLANRLNYNIEGKNYEEKFRQYDKFVKNIQKIIKVDLETTDFFIWFIDFHDFENEPLPKEKNSKKSKSNFSFTKKDFKSTTGKPEDARYLSKRIRELRKVLVQNLGEEFSDWIEKTSKSTVGRPIEGKVKYQNIAWTGFTSPNAIKKTAVESVQLQISIGKNDVSVGIWISYAANKELQKVRQRMIENKEKFIHHMHPLEKDYWIGAYIREDPKKDIDYRLSELDDVKISEISEQLSDKKAEMGVLLYLTPDEAISKKDEVIDFISDNFTELLPAYNFLAGISNDLTISVPSNGRGNDEFGKYKKLLENKKQIILYGPPGTGKTYHADKIAKDFAFGNMNEDEFNESVIEQVEIYAKNHKFEFFKEPNSFNLYKLIKNKNEIRIGFHFSGHEKRDKESAYVGVPTKMVDFLNEVPEEKRFEIIVNNPTHNFVVLPYRIKYKYAKFSNSKNENWDPTGIKQHSFHIKFLEDEAFLPTENGEKYDCTGFIGNLHELKLDEFPEPTGYIRYVTFHQSYSYEEFVEGIKAEIKDNALSYHIDEGIFRKICRDAKDSKYRHILVIDEINRGNISKIFGELITLLENDKREKMYVNLPYSKNRFTIPKNVYIIGTMNTADRSLVQIDIALRRRFGFEELMPDTTLLGECDGISLSQLLKNLNKLILKYTENREFQIGHSYFMEKGESFSKFEQLKFGIETEIIPLLQEYFFNDFDELEKVLGKDFINTIDKKINKLDNNKFKEALKFILNHE